LSQKRLNGSRWHLVILPFALSLTLILAYLAALNPASGKILSPGSPSPESVITSSAVAEWSAILGLPPEICRQLAAGTTSAPANVRKFPFPYRAMLAISSDLDECTPTAFLNYHRFLNTTATTPFGPGLGLDVADSFWLYNGTDYSQDPVTSYCRGLDPTQRQDADFIERYWQCGWIDSLHTFGNFSRRTPGDFVFTRALAEQGWAVLDQAQIYPKIWVDHGTETNVQNCGSYSLFTSSRYQRGDDPRSPFYHIDLTLAAGVKFFWHSRHSTAFGQAFPLSPIKFRDGRKAWTFDRYTGEPAGSGHNWTWVPSKLSSQLTADHLQSLVDNQHYSLVAQHLGQNSSDYENRTSGLYTEENLSALRRLADYQYRGEILVARTSRLLTYAVSQKYVRYATASHLGHTYINIQAIDDPVFGSYVPPLDELRGLTFYCPDPAATTLLVSMTALAPSEITLNPPDESGRPSLSVRWFDPDTTDYSTEY